MRKKIGPTMAIISSLMFCSTVLHAEGVKASNNIPTQQANEDIAKALQTLTQHEIDASFLLKQASENVESIAIKAILNEAQAEREASIKTLFALLQQYHKEAPAHTKDFKGYFMQGYLAMRGLPSDKGVLAALHTNLKILMGSYEWILEKQLPEDVKEKLIKVNNTAQEHLKYAEKNMK